MGLPDSFLRLQGALTQLGWVFSLKVPVLDTLQLSTLCAYENFSKLTSLCNWDSLFVFLPKYTCLSLLFIFLYEPYVPPDCHYCNPHVRLCRVCFIAAAALQPSLWWVKNFLTPAVNPTVSIPRYGCPHPFSFINPCVHGVSLLLLFCLVLSTTLCASFLQ